jgi:hypothetical protein
LYRYTVGSVHIVTRNSYREDIRAFLRKSALPDCIPIHTVKKHQSKAGLYKVQSSLPIA